LYLSPPSKGGQAPLKPRYGGGGMAGLPPPLDPPLADGAFIVTHFGGLRHNPVDTGSGAAD